MTNLPFTDALTEQIQAIDWSLGVPVEAPQSLIDALRARRSRRRKVAWGAVASVSVVVMLTLVLGARSPSRSSAPSVSDYSHIPAITLARLHRAGYTIAPPTHSARITGQQALRDACDGKDWVACGMPRAYLVDMKDNYRQGTEPRFQTYWVIAWPPRWTPMISCGPPTQARNPGPCYAYEVSFAWVDPLTGRSVVGWSGIGVSQKNAPPPPQEGSR